MLLLIINVLQHVRVNNWQLRCGYHSVRMFSLENNGPNNLNSTRWPPNWADEASWFYYHCIMHFKFFIKYLLIVLPKLPVVFLNLLTKIQKQLVFLMCSLINVGTNSPSKTLLISFLLDVSIVSVNSRQGYINFIQYKPRLRTIFLSLRHLKFFFILFRLRSYTSFPCGGILIGEKFCESNGVRYKASPCGGLVTLIWTIDIHSAMMAMANLLIPWVAQEAFLMVARVLAWFAFFKDPTNLRVS